MLINGRLYCRPDELTVYSFKPFKKNKRGDYYTQTPEIILHYRRFEIKVIGKVLMWDMLDAAHSRPLPRIPINNDMFHIKECEDTREDILTDLLNEGDSEYMQFTLQEFHGEYQVIAVSSHDTGVPDTLLRSIWEIIQEDTWERFYGVLPYSDKYALHQREALILDQDIKRVTIYDLGKKICITGSFIVNDLDFRPLQAVIIHKHEDYFLTIAKEALKKYMKYLGLAVANGLEAATNFPKPERPIPTGGMRTSEIDTLGHDRWLSLGITL